MAEFRDKLKEARLEISSKDRQLDVAKRMIQRLNAEKSDVEVIMRGRKLRLVTLPPLMPQIAAPFSWCPSKGGPK